MPSGTPPGDGSLTKVAHMEWMKMMKPKRITPLNVARHAKTWALLTVVLVLGEVAAAQRYSVVQKDLITALQAIHDNLQLLR